MFSFGRENNVFDKSLQSYRGDIDGLRAIAVSVVIIFHGWPSYLPGGFIGVDVFFVISGYLITGIIISELDHGRFNMGHFYARRLRRIGPALSIILLTTLLLWVVVGSYEDYLLLGSEVTASAAFCANILFWMQAGYFDGLTESKPLLHLWSLGVEEQFYIIWPAIVMTIASLKVRRLYAIILVIFISFLINLSFIDKDANAVFYLLPGRLWELGFGGALVWYQRSHPNVSSAKHHFFSEFKSGTGLIMIGVAAAFIQKNYSFPGWWALLPVVGTALVIDGGNQASLNKFIIGCRPLRGIGLISYPIYLWHWPLFSFEHQIGLWNLWAKLFAVTLSVLLAFLTYRYIEIPIRSSQYQPAKIKVLTISLIVASISILGVLGQIAPVWYGDFLMLPNWARLYIEHPFSYRSAYREGTCFLKPDQKYGDFVRNCDGDDTDIVGSKKRVMIWGDSHAAHLYPGLLIQQNITKSFFLSQYTASSCPPIFDTNLDFRPNCQGINDWVKVKIELEKPDILIMSANWPTYIINNGNQVDLSAITKTILLAKKIGVSSVMVLGPSPIWNNSPMSALLSASKNDSTRPPKYLPYSSVTDDALAIDDRIGIAVLKGGGYFVSAAKIFCGKNGCLATALYSDGAGEKGPEPVTWDGSHLTTAGSAALISAIWAQVEEIAALNKE